MKVGFFSNIFWGEFGSAKLARNLVANMAKHKDVEEIKILTVEPSREGLEKNLRNNNIYTVPISIKPPFDRYEFLLKSLTYDKFFRDVDIIHVEHSFEGILAQKCKNKYGIPFIFVREIVSKDLPSLYSKLFLFNLEKLLTLHLDYDILISPSRYMVDNYFVKWGIDPNKIRIIPAGIDTKFFRPKKNVKDIRLRYGIGKDSFVLFSIKILSKSNVMSLKNSIRAFGIFSKKYPDSRYIIAGIGDEKNRNILRLEAKNLGISDKVILLSYIPEEELPDYYINADATLHFFTYEAAVSGSILESMACETPPISIRVGEIPNILNEKCGILSNPDITSFADAIEKMYLIGKNKRKAMGRSARKFVKKKFDIQVIANKYIALYKEFV